ncbi:DoxX family protein [Nonomuraea sp. H19]|uniref:DoxX family protein n=1 Tax=Nonomuraea sp. H19 TaxID=3452206 RepID=UPI003F88AFE4
MRNTQTMNVLLWILQAVLATMFAALGVMKSTQPKEKLEPKLPWTADFSAGTVRFIGLAELAGALGLILPAATGIAAILTPLAATGLALVMVPAALTHVRRKESAAIAVNAVLFIAAAVIAWGRFGPYAL